MEKFTNEAGELEAGKEQGIGETPEETQAKERRDNFKRKLQRAKDNGLGEKLATNHATADDDCYVDVLERFGIKM